MEPNLTDTDNQTENAKLTHYSLSITILLIAVLSFFGAEILTGSTSVEGILEYPLSFFSGLAFYGFQVAIIADISARYNLSLGTIYILGLIYGVLEEGIAIFTMETTSTHKLWLTAYGLNLTWTIYVMMLHAMVTVITTMFILRVLWPKRIRNGILSRSNYIIIIPIIMVLYYFMMASSISAGRVPGIMPVLILILLIIILIFAAWKNSILVRMGKKEILNNQLKYGILIPFAAGMIIPFVLGNRLFILLIPETLGLLFLLVYLFQYFNKFDTLVNMNRKSLWVFSSLILIIMLIGGSFNRTIPSDVVAIIVSVILILFGYMKVRKI
jgi:hypothetical protein